MEKSNVLLVPLTSEDTSGIADCKQQRIISCQKVTVHWHLLNNPVDNLEVISGMILDKDLVKVDPQQGSTSLSYQVLSEIVL